MGFIDKSSLSINAVLTKKGREYLRTAVFGQSTKGEVATNVKKIDS